MASRTEKEKKYVYDLPYFVRNDLCRLLDYKDMWRDLAIVMKYTDNLLFEELKRAERREKSPTDELLSIWGRENHTIVELFVLLSKMQHYQAMVILKPYVDSFYHQLIHYGEERVPLTGEEKEERSGASRAEVKDLGVGSHNLNISETNNLLQDKIVNFPMNQPPEVKILNDSGNPAAGESMEGVNPQRNGSVSPSPQDNTLRLPQGSHQRRLSNGSDVSSLAENCGSVPHIDYQELEISTDNWNKKNILGKGGFGTVFRGFWRNTEVAVKRIEQRGRRGNNSNKVQLEQSFRELHVLNSFRHDNILPLYGFSIRDEPCLVYQFMCNGSLEDRLLCRVRSLQNGQLCWQRTEPLTWHQRHDIAKGTARGLQFLHSSPKPYVHGDIKSANILLDMNFIPRIGDFGLSREGPQNNDTYLKVSRVQGTRPYLPVEFLRGNELSTKVDTYSFGIVLFEMGTGRRAYDETSHELLKDVVENCGQENLDSLIDGKIQSDPVVFHHLMSLGEKCVQKLRKNRPEMEVVLKELEQLPQGYSPRGPNSVPQITKSSVLSANPSANPTNPANPSANPAHPSANPAHPSANPAHPSANPAHPSANPAHPSTNPAHLSANPANPSANPANPSTQKKVLGIPPLQITVNTSHIPAGFSPLPITHQQTNGVSPQDVHNDPPSVTVQEQICADIPSSTVGPNVTKAEDARNSDLQLPPNLSILNISDNTENSIVRPETQDETTSFQHVPPNLTIFNMNESENSIPDPSVTVALGSRSSDQQPRNVFVVNNNEMPCFSTAQGKHF